MLNNQKSPLNEAVGSLIALLRHQRNADAKTVAQYFQVSRAYLRAIETGSRALPAYTSPGLVNLLGLSWESASALVALVSALDTRKEDEYDFGELAARVQQLRAACPAAHYKVVLDLIEATIALKSKGNEESYQIELVKLRDAISSIGAGQASRQAPAPDPASLSTYGMTPMFEDIIDTLADRLAMFPPHVNQVGIKAWERKNSHRISGLFGYVSSPDNLEKSTDDFDWAFVWNSHTPVVKILVQQINDTDARTLQDNFRKGLIRHLRTNEARALQDLQRRVHVKSAQTVHSECRQRLLFDFVTRSNPSSTDSLPVSDAFKRAGRYREFQNAWIYEVKPDSLMNREHIRQIGFLDTYDVQAGTGYAVAIDTEHVKRWLPLFRDEWQTPTRSRKGPRNA